MSDHDLVITGGTVVTPADMFRADIGITDGHVKAIGFGIKGTRTLDADGMLVMPGGVDTHCHIEQLRADGTTDEETFVTGSTSALAGGTTSVVTFSMARASARRLPNIAVSRLPRWSITASIRSSPTRPTTSCSAKCPKSSRRAYEV
jgi:N-acyl-D-aspartate/D-glutamate deacylase